MKKNDYILKVMDAEKQVRIFIARTTNLVEEAHKRHNTSATASAALGRVLTAAVIMGSDLKGENDILTIRINGDGPGGTILATADSHYTVRGMISNPCADIPSCRPGKLDVGGLVGTDGYLEVTKDLGMKQPFTGKVPLTSGEIAEDLARYFLISEQIPSLVSLGVLVDTDLSIKSAAGLFVQALPGARDEVLELIENNVLSLGPISEFPLRSNTLEEMLPFIMSGIRYDILDKKELAFKCNCSRERLAVVLASLSENELAEMTKEKEIEVVCNLCNESYKFNAEEIKAIKKSKP